MLGFKELYDLDISGYVKKKPTFYKDRSTGKMIKTPEDKWLNYLEWSVVLKLLYENGAKKVSFGCVESPQGHIVRYDPKGGAPYLQIFLKIDEDSYLMNYPVISGSTASSNPNQLQIHVAEMRGFVKCVAINTGLGLKLWTKEEEVIISEKEQELQETTFTLNKEINEKILDGVGRLLKKANGVTGDVNDILAIFDLNRTSLSKLIKGFGDTDYQLKKELLDNVDMWVSGDKKSFVAQLKK